MTLIQTTFMKMVNLQKVHTWNRYHKTLIRFDLAMTIIACFYLIINCLTDNHFGPRFAQCCQMSKQINVMLHCEWRPQTGANSIERSWGVTTWKQNCSGDLNNEHPNNNVVCCCKLNNTRDCHEHFLKKIHFIVK